LHKPRPTWLGVNARVMQRHHFTSK
jgi:hypothetical protein